jgi:outer membrane receptor protein involved in Fe transport
MSKKIRLKWFLLAIVVILPITEILGQGKIRGLVTDAETGEPLIGANVVLEGTQKGTPTDVNGEYIIVNVDPGTYNLDISYVGYQRKIVQDVNVESGLTAVINIQISTTMGTTEAVVITADQSRIQKDQTGTRQSVSGSEIKELPVNNFSDVVSLQAGVVSSGRRSFNVRGGRSNEVAFIVDGIMVEDPVNGALATNIDNNAVEELTFLSGTFNAEYGNAMSGVIDISTAEGGSSYSGLVELQKSAFNESSDSLFDRIDHNVVNFRIGGPVFGEDLTFITTGEIYEEESHLPFGYDNGQSLFGKLTWNPSGGLKVNASVRASDEKYKTYNHSYKYIPDSTNFNESKSLQGLLSVTNAFSDRFILTTRLSYFNQEYFNGLNKPNSAYSNSVTYLDNTYVGEFFSSADPTSKTSTNSTTYQLKTDAIWQIDSYNELKAGFSFQQHVVDWYEIFNITATKPYETDIRDRKPYEGAFYLQDKIERDAFVLNIGLRLDLADQQSTFRENPLDPDTETESDLNYQFSPRIGIAHPITANSILRFSYGRFFQNPDFRYVYENNFYEYGTREPLFGSPNLDAQRTTAYELGFVHQFNRKTAIELTAYYKDIRGLIGTEYIAQGQMVNGQTAFTTYSVFVNEDYANVRGAEISVDSRFHKNMDAVVSYTYSVAKGSSSSELEGFPERIPSTRLYPLNFDKTHLVNARFNIRFGEDEGPLWGSYHPLEQTRLNFVLNGSSGYPYTPAGRDIGFVESNSERYPVTYTIDASLRKTVPITDRQSLDFFINVTNLLDRKNAAYVYPDTGEPDEYTLTNQSEEWIQDPSNYFAPRNIIFGMRYQF